MDVEEITDYAFHNALKPLALPIQTKEIIYNPNWKKLLNAKQVLQEITELTTKLKILAETPEPVKKDYKKIWPEKKKKTVKKHSNESKEFDVNEEYGDDYGDDCEYDNDNHQNYPEFTPNPSIDYNDISESEDEAPVKQQSKKRKANHDIIEDEPKKKNRPGQQERRKKWEGNPCCLIFIKNCMVKKQIMWLKIEKNVIKREKTRNDLKSLKKPFILHGLLN